MERIVEFSPAFDRRDPNPNKNYGIHGVDLRMVLKGPLGAVSFLLFTNWQLPHVREEDRKKPRPYYQDPTPADIGYHSTTPTFEGQTVSTDSCPYLDGKPCYSDGSSLQSNDVFNILLEKGSAGVWEELERRYNSVFKNIVQQEA